MSQIRSNDEDSSNQRIVILGAGITGLTLAWELSKTSRLPILLIEKNDRAGGLAGSFVERGMKFDLGSHRIHERYDPNVLSIIKDLLGPEMLRRPRRGRIRIQDIFLDYPPSAFQMLRSFGFFNDLRIMKDYFFSSAQVRNRSAAAGTFEDYAIQSVGKSLYDMFYKPYALKLWGISPDQLAADPAVSRVKKFHVGAIWTDAKKRLSASPSTFFYYPAQGFGQIADKIQERFLQNGGQIQFGTTVKQLYLKNDSEVRALEIRAADATSMQIPTNSFISTAPIDVLHGLVRNGFHKSDSQPLGLRWRSLRILYLCTPDMTASGHETYYFPEPGVLFGRVSEPALYSPTLNSLGGKRALAIETPCTYGDEIWNISDEELAARCIADLRRLKLLRSVPCGPSEFFSRRIKNLYPVYDIGWREKLDKAMECFNSIRNLYMIGRPALFLHCNVDHCMAMALTLARFLTQEKPHRPDWERQQREFYKFSVHD